MSKGIYTQDGLALNGFDPVAYFETGKPEAGSGEFVHEYAGATWRFATAARRDAFVESPERYTPQYGGHCAFAASLGKVEGGAPTQWKVVDGKLYLNSNPVAKLLFGLLPGRIAKADERWGAV